MLSYKKRTQDGLRLITRLLLSLLKYVCVWVLRDPCSGELQTHLRRTQLKGSPFQAWSRSVYCTACYAYCQDFFLANFYPSGPFTCIFSKTSPEFFLY